MGYSCQISDKLNIREITLDDTEDVVRWRHNPRVLNNFLYRGPFTAEIHNNWVNTRVRTGEVAQFIIEEMIPGDGVCVSFSPGEAGKMIHKPRPLGSVFIRDIDMVEKEAEYGIFIGEDDAIGKGYGNEVAAWAVTYARDVLGLKKLFLRVLNDNISAIKSYEHAGFVPTRLEKDAFEGRDILFMAIGL